MLFAVFWIWGIEARSPAIYTVAAWLVWVVNWPHFSATSYRLYSSANLQDYRVTALAVPCLVGAGLLVALLGPAVVAALWVKLFLIWSPYHFSGQSLGITKVYARRAGVLLPPWLARVFEVFIFGTFLTQTLRAEVATAGMSYYGIHVPALGVPAALVTVAIVMTTTSAIVIAGFACVWSVQNRRLFPALILLPAVTQFIWFIPGASVPAFQEFVPAFHGMQYLLIAWSIQVCERATSRQSVTDRFVLLETFRWGVPIFVGGAVLFYVLPRVCAWTFGTPLLFTTGIVVAAVQLHHFIVDGVIWKLRRATVASPLLMSVGSLRSHQELQPMRVAV